MDAMITTLINTYRQGYIDGLMEAVKIAAMAAIVVACATSIYWALKRRTTP